MNGSRPVGNQLPNQARPTAASGLLPPDQTSHTSLPWLLGETHPIQSPSCKEVREGPCLALQCLPHGAACVEGTGFMAAHPCLRVS